MKNERIDTSSLAHTKWNCKYHIVFAPKYRRKVFFEEKRLEIREILRLERRGNNRRRGMSGPYSYVGKHPTQNERFGLYGVSQRQKCIAHISKVGKYEVCIPKSRILV